MVLRLSRGRVSALLIFMPAFLLLAIVSHHPMLQASDNGSDVALAAGIERIAVINAIFHGVVMLLLCLQALGLYGLAEKLDLSRLWVRAGVMFYGLSLALMLIPAIFDGFVTPLLGKHCIGTPADCTSNLAGALALEWAVIQAFTKIALTTQAIGLLSWSIALIFTDRWQRWTGLFGAAVAIIPLVMLGTMSRSISPAILARTIAAEAVWTIAAAWLLWSDFLQPPFDNANS